MKSKVCSCANLVRPRPVLACPPVVLWLSLFGVSVGGLGEFAVCFGVGGGFGGCGSVSGACRSLGFAYRQAAPGDVVELGSGSYGAQSIGVVAGRAGPQVEFRPAAGAQVSFSSLDIRASL